MNFINLIYLIHIIYFVQFPLLNSLDLEIINENWKKMYV